VAWSPEWVGSEQTRFFNLEGNRLKVLSPWRVMPNWPDKGMTRSILNFDRSE
jgi:Lipocalin-like domain